MARIGLISDTHGTLSPQAYNALAGCDFIIHAGDIGNPGILRELETLAPVYAVLGNNDYDEYAPDASGSRPGRTSKPLIEGLRFLVAHYPRDVMGAGIPSRTVAQGEPLPRVCIHGHTHTPRLDAGGAASPADLLICPGSASRPRGDCPRSIGFMEVRDGRVLSVSIESLTGKSLLSWPYNGPHE